MTGEQQFIMLQEITRNMSPEIAKKMHVMFGHVRKLPDDPTMSEITARNFFLVAATLIDKYKLINGNFSDDQRAIMAAETWENWNQQSGKPS
jgi:hypothetical protein